MLPVIAKTPECMGGEAAVLFRTAGDKLRMMETDILLYQCDRDPWMEKAKNTMKLIRAKKM